MTNPLEKLIETNSHFSDYRNLAVIAVKNDIHQIISKLRSILKDIDDETTVKIYNDPRVKVVHHLNYYSSGSGEPCGVINHENRGTFQSMQFISTPFKKHLTDLEELEHLNSLLSYLLKRIKTITQLEDAIKAL